MKYWILTTCTESCDRFAHILVCKGKPTDAKIEAFLKKEYPFEYEEGCEVGWDLIESVPVEF